MSEATGSTINLDGVEHAYMDHYLGPWAMKEDVFRAAFERVRQVNLQLHVQQVADAKSAAPQAAVPSAGAGPSYEYQVLPGGVAVLSVSGTMMKFVSSLSRGTSTVMMRRTLRRAEADDQVAGVLLVFDTPGGTVAGTMDLAEAIAGFGKPVHAYVDGLCCSAGYWAASQGGQITAGRDAIVGSIGTYAVIEDLSGMAAKEGVKVHVVRAGAMKGAGTPGTEVTAEHLAEWQRTVDALNEHFLAAVAAGRAMTPEKVRQLADGRVHVGEAARAAGLIDKVGTFEQALADLRAAIANPKRTKSAGARAAGDEKTPEARVEGEGPESSQKEAQMSQTTQTTTAPAGTNQAGAQAAEKKPAAASIAELKAAFANDPAFALDAAEKGMTLIEAKAAYADVLAQRLQAANQKNAELEAAAKKQPEQALATTAATTGVAATVQQAGAKGAATKLPGVPATASAAAEQTATKGGGDDAVAEFEGRVKALVDAGMPRAKASQKVLAEDEQLRARYVAAKNGKAA